MRKPHMGIHEVSTMRFLHTIGWAVLSSALIVGLSATLGRAALNLKSALTDKPDVAVYLLLPEEEIHDAQLLRSRENDTELDYLIETKDGPKLVTLRRGEKQWFVVRMETLRE